MYVSNLVLFTGYINLSKFPV